MAHYAVAVCPSRHYNYFDITDSPRDCRKCASPFLLGPVETICHHCGLFPRNHVDGWCLFASVKYTPLPEDVAAVQARAQRGFRPKAKLFTPGD